MYFLCLYTYNDFIIMFQASANYIVNIILTLFSLFRLIKLLSKKNFFQGYSQSNRLDYLLCCNAFFA